MVETTIKSCFILIGIKDKKNHTQRMLNFGNSILGNINFILQKTN